MLVSVIIPCYNAEEFVLRAITSVYNQTYKNIEVICIDNNSTDNTWKKLVEIKNTFSNLIIAKENKQGASAARNKGIEISNGEWLQFLDADDELLETKIDHQLDLVKIADPDLAFIAGNCESILIDRAFVYSSYYNFKTGRGIWVNLINSELGCTCSNLFKAEVIKSVDGWNERQASSQENELMFRIMKKFSTVIYDPAPLTIVYSTKTSITNSNLNQNAIRSIELRESIVDYLIVMQLLTDEAISSFYDSVVYNSIAIVSGSDKKLARSLAKKYFFVKLPKHFNKIKSIALKFRLIYHAIKLYIRVLL